MCKDIYTEKVTRASVENGVVTIGLGASGGEGDEETVRLRIPLPKFQDVAARFRDILVKAMEDGWYGEDGRNAVKKIKGGAE